LPAGWCHEIKAKYNVVPMLSWGSLPMNYVETWRSRRCDLVFTTERMSARPLSTCPNLNAAAGSDSGTHTCKGVLRSHGCSSMQLRFHAC
jgi:hypothetical protein